MTNRIQAHFMTNASFGYNSTRGHDKLHLPQPKTNFLKKFIYLKGYQPGILFTPHLVTFLIMELCYYWTHLLVCTACIFVAV